MSRGPRIAAFRGRSSPSRGLAEHSAARAFQDNGCTVLTNQAECVSKNISDLWHRRFCHQNIRGIANLKKGNFVHGLQDANFDDTCECDVCNSCKIVNSSSSRTIEIATKGPLELLHMDLWGPAQVKSLGGSRYLLTVIDDFSRMAFAIPMPEKSRTLEEVQQLIRRLEKQLDLKVRKIRSDNGSEFSNKLFAEFTSHQGIVHQFTNTYSPQMNGVAERFNRTLIEGTRSILADSGLPKHFWAELANTFCYIKNRSSHAKLGGQTPISKFCGKTPSVQHFRIIGSKCTVLKRHQTAVASSTLRGGRAYWWATPVTPRGTESGTPLNVR